MKTAEIISNLQEADATLNADDYKSWCQVRLAISEAIKALQQKPEQTQDEHLLNFLQWFDKPENLLDHEDLIRRFKTED